MDWNLQQQTDREIDVKLGTVHPSEHLEFLMRIFDIV